MRVAQDVRQFRRMNLAHTLDVVPDDGCGRVDQNVGFYRSNFESRRNMRFEENNEQRKSNCTQGAGGLPLESSPM